MAASLPVVVASSTIADELTLIIPLGLLILTLAWWGWMSYRGRRSR